MFLKKRDLLSGKKPETAVLGMWLQGTKQDFFKSQGDQFSHNFPKNAGKR